MIIYGAGFMDFDEEIHLLVNAIFVRPVVQRARSVARSELDQLSAGL